MPRKPRDKLVGLDFDDVRIGGVYETDVDDKPVRCLVLGRIGVDNWRFKKECFRVRLLNRSRRRVGRWPQQLRYVR